MRWAQLAKPRGRREATGLENGSVHLSRETRYRIRLAIAGMYRKNAEAFCESLLGARGVIVTFLAGEVVPSWQ